VNEFAPNSDKAQDVFVQPGGRTIVLGNHLGGTNGGNASAGLTDRGALDPTYGTGGLVQPFFMDTSHLYDRAMLSDGRVVVLAKRFPVKGNAQAYLFRSLVDGAVDPTFQPPIPFPYSRDAVPIGVDAFPDGKVLTVALYLGDHILLKFNADGSPDTSISANGIKTLSLGRLPGATVLKLTSLADGKFLLSGFVSGAFFVASYCPGI
jgi:uncharacterized delta-60 repeat protein